MSLRLLTLPQQYTDTLLEELSLDPTTHSVKLHIPNDCERAVLSKWLRRDPSYQHRDQKGNAIIMAEVMERDVTSPPPAATLRETAPSNTAEPVADEKKFPILAARPSRKRNAAVTFADDLPPPSIRAAIPNKNEVKAQFDPQCHYIRIGVPTNTSSTVDGDSIPCTEIIVAEVPRKANRSPDSITFRHVESWYIGGISIGYCALGKKFDIDATPQPYTADAGLDHNAWTTRRAITPMLIGIIDGLHTPVWIEADADRKRRNSKMAEVKTIEQAIEKKVKQAKKDKKAYQTGQRALMLTRLAVRMPTYAPYASKPSPPPSNTTSRARIDAVVFFRNMIGSKASRKLDTAVQVSLDHDETLMAFADWVEKGDPLSRRSSATSSVESGRSSHSSSGIAPFAGLESLLPASLAEMTVEYEVWVLPHSREGSVEMFCWRMLDGWTAGDFLDEVVAAGGGGRRLWVEVHVMAGKEMVGEGKKRKTG